MKPIKFGNEKSLLINNNVLKNEIINKVENTYEINIENKRYHFLDKNRAKELKQKNHSFVLNTYGPKYYIFLTKYNSKYYALYISRKTKEILLVKTRFCKDLYEDTCIEGEIIKIEDNWYFFASDIILHKKENILMKGYQYRYELLNDIIKNKYIKDKQLEPFTIIIKDKFKYNQLTNVKEKYIDSCPFRVNGFLFKSEELSSYDILYIFPECRNKKEKSEENSDSEKEKEKNIITNENKSDNIYILRNTDYPDVYELYKNNKKVGYAGVPNIGISSMIRKWYQDQDKTELRVSCIEDSFTKKIIPNELVI